MRIVLDANVLVSGIFWGGYPHRVLEMWARDRVEVVVSHEILTEYDRVITQLGHKEGLAHLSHHWLMFIGQYGIVATVRTPVQVCRDPADNKYLSCAVDGNADFIVSGDRDLLVLKEFIGIPILTPRQFIDRHG
jgi:putative PIN family toxin of toxin-antitoxin system